MSEPLKQYLLNNRFVNAVDNYFSGNGLEVRIGKYDATLIEHDGAYVGSFAEVQGRIEILLDKDNKD